MFNFSKINKGGFSGYGLTDQIQYNLKFFLDQNFVAHGAYDLILNDSFSFHGDDENILKPISDRRYEDGRVWNGAGREWVWENVIPVVSGITPPFRVSGVIINDDFFDNNITGMFAHHVDYLNGRIIFDSPQDPTATVKAEYVRRNIFVGFADSKEFQHLLLDTIKEFFTDTEPEALPTRDNQIWLPAIFIEVDSGFQTGLELGGGQIKTRRVVFHVFAENEHDRNILLDILDFNSRKAFIMADLEKITWPFDEFGDVTTVNNWEELINLHPYKKLRIIDGKYRKINSLNNNIFRGRIDWICEVDVGGI
jgi:hypothetical protein